MSKIHLEPEYFTSDVFFAKYNYLTEKAMEHHHIYLNSYDELVRQFNITDMLSHIKINSWKNPDNLPFAWITTNGWINNKYLVFTADAFSSGKIVYAYDSVGNYNGWFADSNNMVFPTPKLPDMTSYSLVWLYSANKALVKTPRYSVKGTNSLTGIFNSCDNLIEINMYDFDKSFSISACNKMPRENIIKLFKEG